MIHEVFEQHNQQMAALVGREITQQTWERYDTAKRHTQAFMQWKYKVDDMEIKNIKYQFITDFEFWLKSERKCDHNTTMQIPGELEEDRHHLRQEWLAGP